MPEPFFSIVLPVYNVERYLSQCMDSLLAQSFDDFEIVAVNDGSTDGSGELLRAYAARHPHSVRLIEQENRGLGPARNVAVDASRGRYVVFVDSDDWVDPTYLEDTARVLAAEQPEILIYDHYEHDAEGGSERYVRQRYEHGEPDLREAIRRTFSAVWVKVYKRDVLIRGERFPNLRHEDLVTPLHMADCQSVLYKGRAYYHYRYRRPGAILARGDSAPDQLRALILVERLSRSSRYRSEILYFVWHRRGQLLALRRYRHLADHLAATAFVARIELLVVGNRYCESIVPRTLRSAGKWVLKLVPLQAWRLIHGVRRRR
jgi:glycosyltransferase involved in cell wall biosynthesis